MKKIKLKIKELIIYNKNNTILKNPLKLRFEKGY